MTSAKHHLQILGAALTLSPLFLWGDADLGAQRPPPSQKAGAMETNAFQLSRIYSQGWNAARKLLAGRKSHLDAAEAAARHPYPPRQQYSRSTEVLTEAL